MLSGNGSCKKNCVACQGVVASYKIVKKTLKRKKDFGRQVNYLITNFFLKSTLIMLTLLTISVTEVNKLL